MAPVVQQPLVDRAHRRYLKVVQALLQMMVGTAELLLELLLRVVIQLIVIKLQELLILWRHRKDPRPCWETGSVHTRGLTLPRLLLRARR